MAPAELQRRLELGILRGTESPSRAQPALVGIQQLAKTGILVEQASGQRDGVLAVITRAQENSQKFSV
jgi:hypothetical protein